MSQPATTINEGPVEYRPPGRWHRGRRTTLTIGVLVAAIVVGGGSTLLRDSDREFDGSNGMSDERPVGERVWTVLVHGRTAPRGTVTIDRLEPDFASDRAELEVEYAICHLDADALAEDQVGSSGYGVRDADVQRYCSRLTPAEGSSIELGTEPGQELLASFRTTRPGRSVVESHRIEFSEAWQRGTADILVTIDITSR